MKAVKIFLLISCVFVCGVFTQDTKTKDINKSTDTTITDDAVKTDKDSDKTIKNDSDKIEKVETITAKNEKLNTSENIFSSREERYRIGFQDILQITVYRHGDLSQTISVGQDGTITLPRINEPVVAVCKTERELADLITELYKSYLRNPFVTVRTLEQRSQPFAVIGAVNKPGNFFLNQKTSLLSLLSLAGGPLVEKSGSRIQVARIGNLSACNPSDENDSEIEFYTYNINDVMTGKENPWMQPGDIVSVLEAEEAYVVGDVFEPAKITLKEPVTLSEAIARAGGESDTAKLSKVVIQRKEKGNPVRVELVFNLKDIRANKIPDPLLQANDIVTISSSNTKIIKKGLFKVLTSSIANIFYRFP